MGTPDFAVPSLRKLARTGYNVIAVVTNRDEPQGRGLKIRPTPVKVAALELNIPVLEVDSLRDKNFIASLREIEPDLIVVVAFRILPKEVFEIPRLGTFNLHASLLPKYRGAAPINWAIINGERETGVTTFFLDESVDTGKIILQKRTFIGENETAGELAERLSELGASAVVETIKLIEEGNLRIIEQDNTLASKAPKIQKEDCLIDWSRSALDVHNFIRGFSPTPGAYTFLNGKMLKIFRSRTMPAYPSIESDKFPDQGTIVIDSGRMLVRCADSFVEILELQMEGKKKLTAGDFLRGARIETGSILQNSKNPT
jgi:methionyl-tRNA formyltransferase